MWKHIINVSNRASYSRNINYALLLSVNHAFTLKFLGIYQFRRGLPLLAQIRPLFIYVETHLFLLSKY